VSKERRGKESTGDEVKTTAVLPRALWRTAKIRAMDEETDLNSVIVAALQAYLRKGDR